MAALISVLTKHVVQEFDPPIKMEAGVEWVVFSKGVLDDARRYRLLTNGDRSITVHENDGTPVGFFCGTREEVSEQIDADLARDGE